MREFRGLRWACLCALVILLGPAAAIAPAAGRPFIPPVEAELIRGYEPAAHRYGPGHRGIDYSVPVGTPVRASAEGEVSFAGSVGHGLYVTIQHAGGIATTYSFLSEVLVSRGEQVGQGRVIGLSGEGHSDGPDALHFGAKLNGEYIDPMLLLGYFDDVTDLINLSQISHPTARGPPDPAFAAPGTVQSSRGPFGHAGAEGPDAPVHFLPAAADEPATSASTGRQASATDQHHVDSPWIRNLHPEASPATSPPNPGATAESTVPHRIHDWWAGLDQEWRDRFLEQRPDRWGRTAGVFSRDRDRANRMILERELEAIEEYMASPEGRAEIRAKHRSNHFNPMAWMSEFDSESRPERIHRTIRELQALRRSMPRNPRNRLQPDDVYLLDFDLEFANGEGTAVVALGDPQTADHIAVMVPGINNAPGTIRRPLDGMAALRSTVYDQIGRDVGDRTSTLVWMGYDSPNGLQDAVNQGEAREGFRGLVRFVNHLRQHHQASPESPEVTVVGHSYGVTVAGKAGRAGLDAERMALLGGAGVGSWFARARHFPQKIWAATADSDPIRIVSWAALGTDATDPRFGANPLPLGPENRGHGKYLDFDTEGLLNLARLIVGRIEEIE